MKHSATSDGQYFRASDDSLTHHGIKGQKWGVRRFENEDGTLTPEGKERYRKESKERIKRAIIAGTTITAAALVVYGAYKINSKSKGDSLDDLDRSIANGKNMVEYYMKKKKIANAISKGFDKTADIYWDRADKARDKYLFGEPEFKEANSENYDRLINLGSKYLKKSNELLGTARKSGTQANELGMVLDKLELDRKYPWAYKNSTYKDMASEYVKALSRAVDYNNKINKAFDHLDDIHNKK